MSKAPYQIGDRISPRHRDDSGQAWLRQLLLDLGLDKMLKGMDTKGQAMRYSRARVKRKPSGKLELHIFATVLPANPNPCKQDA